MRKAFFALIISLASIVTVNARECYEEVLIDYQNALTNVTYTLSYADNYVDMNGDFLEGYFKLNVTNLPENYYMSVSDSSGVQYTTTDYGLHLKGGVYELEIYNTSCENVIKTFEVKIPSYKQYCEIEKKCSSEYTWFDGTYENKSENYTKDNSNKVNTKLIVVLVSLIVIVVVGAAIILVIKRRHSL